MNQMEKLFDMICYLNDGAQGDFSLKDKEGKKHSYDSRTVQAFVAKQIHKSLTSAYGDLGNGKAIQAFTGTTDLAKITTNVWNAFQETPNWDMFWQEAFRAVPLRKGQLEWSIGNVVSGVALQLLEEGRKVEYNKITGTVVKGSVDLYGSGLQIDWRTLEGRDLAGFYNSMTDFRNKRMAEYADLFYGLLATAAADTAIAWQGESTDTVTARDIATLNYGYRTIGEATKDSGYGDTANARMLVYASPALKDRLNAALRATNTALLSGGQTGAIVDANINVRYTYNSAISSNTAVMVLPGNKIQNSIYMQEKSFERVDPDNLSWLKSSFTAMGGIVGDTAQTAELTFTSA